MRAILPTLLLMRAATLMPSLSPLLHAAADVYVAFSLITPLMLFSLRAAHFCR